jgi:hypothetical protein
MSAAIGMRGRQPAQGRYAFDVRDFGMTANDTTKAAANAVALQAAIDAAAVNTNVYRQAEVMIPSDGIYYLNAPVFLSNSGLILRGHSESAQLATTGYGGPQVILSAPRMSQKLGTAALADLYGLLDSSVASAPGRAYGAVLNQVRLAFQGTPLDVGPPSNSAPIPSFYQTDSQYTIAFVLVPRGSSGLDGTVASFGGVTISIGGSGTLLTLQLVTTDGLRRLFTTPLALAPNQPLRVVLLIDLNACQVCAYVNNVGAPVDSYQANANWTAGANLRLNESGWGGATIGGSINYVLGGFKVATGLQFPMNPAVGQPIGNVNDSTYAKTSSGYYFALNPSPTSTADYLTTNCWSPLSRFTGIALLTPTDLTTTKYMNADCTIRDLYFKSMWGYGQGVLYSAGLDFHIDNCSFRNGAQGVASLTGTTSYPFYMSRCRFDSVSLAAIHLGWGLNWLREISIGATGRYGLMAHSNFYMRDFFIAEGGSTRSAIRSYGLTYDGTLMKLADGTINYEAYSARYMVEVANVLGPRLSLELDNVTFGNIYGGQPIRVSTPPGLPTHWSGRFDPSDVVLRGFTGAFVGGNATAMVGVPGTNVRVRHEGPYAAGTRLAVNYYDTKQPTWSGFAPGSEPGGVGYGVNLANMPPAPAVDPSFVGLANLPGLQGRYRASAQPFQPGDPMPALYDDVSGSSRTAVNLQAALPGLTKATLTTLGGRTVIYFAPDGTYYLNTPYLVESTLGLTILFVSTGTYHLFKSRLDNSGRPNNGLMISGAATLGTNDYAISPSNTTASTLAAYAVRFDRQSGALEWWINGRKDASTLVTDPAVLAKYQTAGFNVASGGGKVYLNELLVVFGPLSDGDLRNAMYQLMNDYGLYG